MASRYRQLRSLQVGNPVNEEGQSFIKPNGQVITRKDVDIAMKNIAPELKKVIAPFFCKKIIALANKKCVENLEIRLHLDTNKRNVKGYQLNLTMLPICFIGIILKKRFKDFILTIKLNFRK